MLFRNNRTDSGNLSRLKDRGSETGVREASFLPLPRLQFISSFHQTLHANAETRLRRMTCPTTFSPHRTSFNVGFLHSTPVMQKSQTQRRQHIEFCATFSCKRKYYHRHQHKRQPQKADIEYVWTTLAACAGSKGVTGPLKGENRAALTNSHKSASPYITPVRDKSAWPNVRIRRMTDPSIRF